MTKQEYTNTFEAEIAGKQQEGLSCSTMSDGASTLGAARVAAVAALLGALLGAAIPGVFLLTATDRQVESDAERSRDEFVRLQRQSAYAKFVTDANGLDEAVATEIRRTAGSQEYDCPTLIELNKRYDELKADLALVRLIGSEPAIEAAFAVVGEFRTLTGRRTCPDLLLSLDFAHDGVEGLLKEFLEVSRRDLTEGASAQRPG